jgi:hypothetical protein
MAPSVNRPAGHGSGKSSDPKPQVKHQSKDAPVHRTQKVVNVMKTDL